MTLLVRLDKNYWPNDDFGHWCPGCNCGHEISVNQKNASGAQWVFNDNFKRPTFSPSINIRVNPPNAKGYQPKLKTRICHYHIKDGLIHFLKDCNHNLRGKVVKMPPIPEGKYLTSTRI